MGEDEAVSGRSAMVARLVRSLAAQDGSEAMPYRLCRAGQQLMGADGVAVTLAYTLPSRITLCATTELAGRLEDLQDVVGEGPGSVAYDSGGTVATTLGGPDDDAVRRWPALMRAVADLRLSPLDLLALPIRPDGHVLGVLTCHIDPGRALALGRDDCAFLADAIGAMLVSDWKASGETLEGPWASRARVHQATGMVVAQLGVVSDDALAVLRAHAFAAQRPLADVAADVLTGTIDFLDDSKPAPPEGT